MKKDVFIRIMGKNVLRAVAESCEKIAKTLEEKKERDCEEKDK